MNVWVGMLTAITASSCLLMHALQPLKQALSTSGHDIPRPSSQALLYSGIKCDVTQTVPVITILMTPMPDLSLICPMNAFVLDEPCTGMPLFLADLPLADDDTCDSLAKCIGQNRGAEGSLRACQTGPTSWKYRQACLPLHSPSHELTAVTAGSMWW